MPRPFFRIPKLGPPKMTPRQKVLAAWHGIDLQPLETIHRRPAQSTGEVVARLAGELRLEQRRADAEIVRVWDHLIDPNIVAHARPTGLHKGTLFVSVDTSVWLDEIVRYRRREILDRLQHSFGKTLIVRISFRIG